MNVFQWIWGFVIFGGAGLVYAFFHGYTLQNMLEEVASIIIGFALLFSIAWTFSKFQGWRIKKNIEKRKSAY